MARVTPEQVLEALDIHLSGAFKWGRKDCLLAVADAYLHLRGVDVAAPLRGLYDSEGAARNLISLHGGFVAGTEKLMAVAGLSPLEQPVSGCIGLSSIQGVDTVLGHSFCICIHGDVWAGKSLRGYSSKLKVERFWDVPADPTHGAAHPLGGSG